MNSFSAATGKAYRYYALTILTLVYTMSLVDRGVISLLLQPIKEDLHLSDTQLGFLTGIAFALFYATLGLPIARWADRGNRATITSLAVGIWGATVMSCLFVKSFAQLLLARVGASVGEAGSMPPTYSLLGDYFPTPTQRTRAMATYMIANPASSLVAYIVGGYLNTLYGWRVTFFLLGLPGLVLSALVWLTIREPRARQHADVQASGRKLPSLIDVVIVLWHQASAWNLMVAITLLFTMGLGLHPWYAAFLMRSHAMGTADVGIWLGLIFGVGGAVGTLIGGYVTTHWCPENAKTQIRLSAIMIGSLVPFFVMFLLLPERHQALAALFGLIVVLFFFVGPTYALIQRLVPDAMRATTLAIMMLFANLIGMGLGPLAVGILSDALHRAVGSESLRYAMLAMSLVAWGSAYYFWRAARTVNRDLVAVASRRIETLA